MTTVATGQVPPARPSLAGIAASFAAQANGRQFVPEIGFSVIPGHALTLLVRQAETVLRLNVTLLSRFAPPKRRLIAVLWYTTPILVQTSESKLCASVALLGGPCRALDLMISSGQLFVCRRINLFRKFRTVLNQQPLDSHFRRILEPRSSVFPEIQDSCHAQSRNDDLAGLPVSLHAFRCPLPNLWQYGRNPRAQRFVRNAGNFVDVLTHKEIYNLRGESSGCLPVHLRGVNVTKVLG